MAIGLRSREKISNEEKAIMSRMREFFVSVLCERARILAEYEPNEVLGEAYVEFCAVLRKRKRVW